MTAPAHAASTNAPAEIAPITSGGTSYGAGFGAAVALTSRPGVGCGGGGGLAVGGAEASSSARAPPPRRRAARDDRSTAACRRRARAGAGVGAGASAPRAGGATDGEAGVRRR